MPELTRRALLGGVAAGLASTAGCTALVSGDEPLEFEATRATVTDDALNSTGYELVSEESPTVTREFSVAGQTREVTVTNHATTYQKNIDFGPLGSVKAAMFAVFTTPQIQVAGQSFNPIGEMSNEELLKQVGSRYDGLTVGDRVGSSEVDTLDKTVTVERYEATATVEGQEIPIYLLLGRFKHGGDYVVPVAGYPRQLAEEETNAYTLVENLEH